MKLVVCLDENNGISLGNSEWAFSLHIVHALWFSNSLVGNTYLEISASSKYPEEWNNSL